MCTVPVTLNYKTVLYRFGDVTNPEGMPCSPYQPFVVVLKKLFLKKQISPFALNFERHNFADVVYAQTATLHTKVRKVKS